MEKTKKIINKTNIIFLILVVIITITTVIILQNTETSAVQSNAIQEETLKPIVSPDKIIGLVIADGNPQYDQMIANSIEKACNEKNWDILRQDCGGERGLVLSTASTFIDRNVDTLFVLAEDTETAKIIEGKADQAKVNVIFLDNSASEDASYYGIDYKYVGVLAGETLSKKAHEKLDNIDYFIMIYESDTQTNKANMLLDAENICKSKLGLNEKNCIRQKAHVDIESVKDQIIELLSKSDKSKKFAILCENDIFAKGTAEALKEQDFDRNSVVISFGCSALAKENFRSPDNSWVGSIAFFPEEYGINLIKMIEKNTKNKGQQAKTIHKLVDRSNINDIYPEKL